jgi:malate dehydrogenase
MKITVVGAGNVGANCAIVIAEKELCNELVLLDEKQGLAESKALDINNMAPMARFDTRAVGVTNDYSATANSQVIVVAAGITRRPGTNHEELVSTNAQIVSSVMKKAFRYSPNALFIIVTSPLNTMCYCAMKSVNIAPNRVIGMAGLVDTSRFRSLISEELKCSSKEIQATILGGHGDHMIPIPRYTTVNGAPITQLLPKDKIDEIIRRTRLGGGEMVNLMGNTAWIAPGYATARMVEAIVHDQKRYYPCSAYLTGQYGLNDIFFGVSVKLGANGIEHIMELELNEAEQAQISLSANSIHQSINLIYKPTLVNV